MSLTLIKGCACLFAAVLVAGCRPPATDTNPHQQTEQESRAAIEQQAARFSQAYVDGDIDELVSIYTADGMAAPGNRDFIVGHEPMSAYWRLPDGVRVLRHKTTAERLVIDGNHAYDWGYYEGQTARDGVELPSFNGKYLIVWERGVDGVWRMAADMWNSLPADQG